MAITDIDSIEVYLSPEEMNPILQKMGIEINAYGVVDSSKFPEAVNLKISKVPFFYQPTYSERLAISIALYEDKNKKLAENYEIMILNHSLGTSIDRNLISKMRSLWLESGDPSYEL